MTPEAYLPILTEVLTAIASAIVYSTVWYLRRRGQGEPFEISKAVATAIVGAVIGASMVLAGDPLRELTLEQKLVAYAGVISLVQAIVKSVNEELRLWDPDEDEIEVDDVVGDALEEDSDT